MSTARGSAASFEGGMTELKTRLWPGLFLTGEIVLMSLGFRPEKFIRWCIGDR